MLEVSGQAFFPPTHPSFRSTVGGSSSRALRAGWDGVSSEPACLGLSATSGHIDPFGTFTVGECNFEFLRRTRGNVKGLSHRAVPGQSEIGKAGL